MTRSEGRYVKIQMRFLCQPARGSGVRETTERERERVKYNERKRERIDHVVAFPSSFFPNSWTFRKDRASYFLLPSLTNYDFGLLTLQVMCPEKFCDKILDPSRCIECIGETNSQTFLLHLSQRMSQNANSCRDIPQNVPKEDSDKERKEILMLKRKEE